MKFRFAALLVALPAVIAGLLVTVPAEAASMNARVITRHVAMFDSGGVKAGRVYVQCLSKSTCKGTLNFDGQSRKSYSIKGKSSAYVSVLMAPGSKYDPYASSERVHDGDYWYVSGVKLTIDESSPSNSSARTYTDLVTETEIKTQQITGSVNFQGNPKPTNVKVQLETLSKGGNSVPRYTSGVLTDGQTFTTSVPLGINNATTGAYRLRIIGTDQDGHRRSWYWQGTDGNSTGGGKYIREGSEIRVTRQQDFNADFYTGTLSGGISSTDGSADVTVAAPPVSFSSSGTLNRDLDLSGCANVFGETSVGGSSYTVNFLPSTASPGDYKNYAVRVDDHSAGSIPRWNGTKGSCFDAISYDTYGAPSQSNLVTPTLGSVPTSTMGGNSNSLAVNASLPSGTTVHDREVKLRERIGSSATILYSPVVKSAFLNGSGDYTFENVPAGRYWVEIGRRTGCSYWYRSRYANNGLYLQGDRSNESWKAFRKLNDLSGGKTSGKELLARTASPYRATETQNSSKKGWGGWMYREYCGATSAGRYYEVTVTSSSHNSNSPTVSKGATVTGKVTRGGGRTNKEMLVSLYSTGGTLVMRTDLTDGSGKFSIKGLDSGTYRIKVNSDSWRGITRTFSGKHTIRVTKGKSYSAGTLRFQNQSDKADAD